MRKVFLIIIIALQVLTGVGQVDRSKMPEPGPAPDIEISNYETFILENGLTVFVVENDKQPVVTYKLLVDRDPVREAEKTGYVEMAGKLLGEGTTHRSKEELDEAVDFIGGQLSISPTSVIASSLSEYKGQLFELMADVILNPAFPESALEKLKVQALSELQVRDADPAEIVFRVRDVLLYGASHPYGEPVTEETIANITLEDCKNYYDTYFNPSHAYLAMVGDIDKAEARQLAERYLGKWEGKEIAGQEYADPENPSETELALVHYEHAVQSLIVIAHVTELPPGSADIIPMKVANKVLGGAGGRLFQNLREDKGYTYGSGSRYVVDREIGSFYAVAGVRNEVTDSAITEMLWEMNRIRDERITIDELQDAQRYITGEFGRSLEDPQTIADFAIDTWRYNLPEDYYRTYLDEINSVTPDQVQQTAQKHILPDNCIITVVGKMDEVAEGLERFGQLRYYDKYGKLVEQPAKD